MGYRADIDGLRAVAILLVVGFHVGAPGFAGGFVGVDVFFVISGYLITGLLWEELRSQGSISWSGFYARRVRRLLPALVVVVVATLLIGVVVMVPDPELRWLGQSAVAVAASVANMFFYAKTSGYFGADAELLPLLNMWSLAVEEQFYLVWPVLLTVGWWLAGRSRRHGRMVLVALFAVIGIGSFALSVALVQSDQGAAFYWMPPRLWELLAGGVLAIAVRRLPQLSHRGADVMAVVGVGLVAFSALTLDAGSAFPGVAAVPVVVGTMALVVAGSGGRSTVVGRALSLGPVVAIGTLSYSWYLIHWPLLVFARLTTLETSLVRDSLIALGALGLAALSFRFVEQPFRVGGRRVLVTTRASLLGGVGALVLLAGAGLVVLADGGSLSRLEMSPSAAAALEENRTVAASCDDPEPGVVVGCAVAGGSELTLALVGDSHALALLPAARSAADELGWGLDVLWSTACPFVVDYRPPDGVEPEDPACIAENDQRMAYLLDNADRIGGVVVTGRSTSTVLQETAAGTELAAAAWESALESTIGRLTAAGIAVFVVHDVPHFDHDVPECTIRKGADCDVAVDAPREFRAPVATAEADAVSAAGPALAGRWDPFEVLCDAQRCSALDGDVVLYRDRTHLSEAGAAFVGTALVPELARFLDETGVRDG